MRIDVLPLIKGECGEICVDEKLSLDGIFDSETSFEAEGARIDGVIKSMLENLQFKGSVTAKIKAKCDRCLCDVRVDFMQPFLYTIQKDSAEDEDANTFNLCGSKLDLDGFFYNIFILNLPEKFLCKKDCKGICSKCGTDLNERLCDCGNQKEIHPGMEVLKKLL